jgi:hypothetical protein
MDALRCTGLEVMMKALVVIASALLGAIPAQARDEVAGIEAIWLRQVVSFVYRADSTTYSCSALRQKVAGMLSFVGARNARGFGGVRCDDFASTVSMQIAIESPVEATAENLLAITDYDTKHELVARVRGEQLAAADQISRFPAAWTTLSLRESGMQLTAADCELVHQLRRQVFPKLSVQIVQEPARCVPTLARSSRMPAMKVRALLVAG